MEEVKRDKAEKDEVIDLLLWNGKILNELATGVLRAFGASFSGSIGEIHLPEKWRKRIEKLKEEEEGERRNPANWVVYN